MWWTLAAWTAPHAYWGHDGDMTASRQRENSARPDPGRMKVLRVRERSSLGPSGVFTHLTSKPRGAVWSDFSLVGVSLWVASREFGGSG